MNFRLKFLLPILLAACANTDDSAPEVVDPVDECVFCEGRADAFGISRHSYLAYGIVKVANQASLDELDHDVPLDGRAARGIVDRRPFQYIEEVDTVPYVGATAFGALARYAEDQGLVPFCGDGELQAILEACDDGNAMDGDGCSAACAVEAGAQTNYLASRPEVIRGSDVGVGLVKPDGYYLRARPIRALGATTAVQDILGRADSIQANTRYDGVVTWDELALLSKEPFYSSLFAEEKAALKVAWQIFEVNSSPVAVVEYGGGANPTTVPFLPSIERVGPLEVEGTLQIADLDDDEQKLVARRLQQMAGANHDNNDATVHLFDLEKGMGDYSPVFSSDEIRWMEAIKERMFDAALPLTGGDFAIEFSSMPNSGSNYVKMAEFDGWAFGYTTGVTLHHDAYNPRNVLYADDHFFDANLRSEFSFRTTLTFNGASNWVCSSSLYGACENPFRYEGVRFIHLDGTNASAGRERAVMLMEHWKSGKRVYNRLVEFKNTYTHIDRRTTYHNTFAAARPVVAGQPMSLRKTGTVSYGSKTYERFGLVEVQTAFNKNVEKFFPISASMLEERLTPGRYNAFEGVVIEVHDSRAVIAYFDGCELPMAFQDGHLATETCAASGRQVKIVFTNIAATLWVEGADRREVDLYNVNHSFNGREHLLLGLDRSYFVVR